MNRIRLWWAPCAFAALVVGSAGAVRELGDFTLGLNVHRVQARNESLLAELQQPSPRLDLLWSEIAGTDGVVQPGHPVLQSLRQLDAHREPPVMILAYGHPALDGGNRPTTPAALAAFARYARDVVQAVGQRPAYFEVWNEWNTTNVPGGPPGDPAPAKYLALLQRTYAAIKAQSPAAVVLGGALAGTETAETWLAEAVRLGLLDHCDGLSFHPYFYSSAEPAERLPEIGLTRRIQSVIATLAGHPKGAAIPLYLTELGWPAFDGEYGVTADEQAKFLARSVFLVALEPRVHGLWLYELRDPPGAPRERERHFGITHAEGSPKPAYAVLRELKLLLSLARSVEEVANDSASRARTLKFVLKDGSETWACWTLQPGDRVEVSLQFDGPSAAPLIRQVGAPKSSSPRAGSGPGTLLVEAGDFPVLLTGQLHGGRVVATRSVAALPAGP